MWGRTHPPQYPRYHSTSDFHSLVTSNETFFRFCYSKIRKPFCLITLSCGLFTDGLATIIFTKIRFVALGFLWKVLLVKLVPDLLWYIALIPIFLCHASVYAEYSPSDLVKSILLMLQCYTFLHRCNTRLYG